MITQRLICDAVAEFCFMTMLCWEGATTVGKKSEGIFNFGIDRKIRGKEIVKICKNNDFLFVFIGVQIERAAAVHMGKRSSIFLPIRASVDPPHDVF
jgi:hypothetical protein